MRQREVYFWVLQLITAAVIAVLLGTHLFLLHIKGEPLEWSGMIQRARSSSWLIFYVIFLAAVLYHGLYGLRAILLELWSSPESARKITAVLVALGVAAFAFGTYVPFKLFAG